MFLIKSRLLRINNTHVHTSYIVLSQALEAEIVSHEPLIEAVANTAHHMVESKHYAATDVSQRLDDLQRQLQKLKDVAAERRAKLLDAVESQMVSMAMFGGRCIGEGLMIFD